MRTQNLTRQIVYAMVIVLLFVAMFPYRAWLKGVHNNYDLGEATIGIDNGSFVLNLFALGGARGIVANALWEQANRLQKVHEWDRLEAKIDMITKLQPHFLSVWTFQGWNLAYNVSVEWDDPADKYHYIKTGINYLKEGVERNQRSPDLIWDTAWTYYHKIGQADEAVILRKLFRDDEDEKFKTEPINGEVKNDNFLLGYGWFKKSVKLVDDGGTRLAPGVKEEDIALVDPHEQRKGRPGDINFRAMPAHAQSRYALSLEKASIKGVEATFGERAAAEWERSLTEWQELGRYPFAAHNILPGQTVRDTIYMINSTLPDVYEKLTENERLWTSRWADQTNYRYWVDRSTAEMEPEGYRGRQLFYEGTVALKEGRFINEVDKNGVVKKGAVDSYREGLDLWKVLLARHTTFSDDQLSGKDTGLIVRRYVQALRNAGEDVPEDYPFKELLQAAMNDTSIDPFDALEVIKSAPKPEGRPGGR